MASRNPSIRLVLASVVLPALVVAADEALLAFAYQHRWSVPTTLAVLGWFVAQTGLLCYVAGKWLPNWGWRLVVLFWSMLLINLLLRGPSVGSDIKLLALAFSSGQIGALAAWVILGASAWWRRLAILPFAVVPVFLFGEAQVEEMGWDVDAWRSVMLVQVVATCVLVAALHVSGYRIELVQFGAAEGGPGPVQFSVRHLLIATMAVAIVMTIVQALLRTSQSQSGRQWLQASADGVVLAVVSLAAMWAALGAGRWWIKAMVFILLALAAGSSLYWLEKSVLYRAPVLFKWEQPLTQAGWWWLAWALLAGSLLAGMLLVLRATGHRLVRRRRTG